MPGQFVLFGGSYDPVHHGHLIVARAIAEQLGQKVTFVPAASPPHKTATTAAEHRLAMLKLAVEGDELLDVSDIELRRQGPSYTYDTLMEFKNRYGPDVALCWIIGADMLEDFHIWHRAADVLDLARIVVAVRPPWERRLDEILDGLARRLPQDKVSQLGQDVVRTPLIDISSTDIRSRVRQKKSIRYLVTDNVAEYIAKQRLYA